MAEVASKKIQKYVLYLENRIKEGRISEGDSDLIKLFIPDMSIRCGGKGLSDARKKSIVASLIAMRAYMNDVDYVDIDKNGVNAAIEKYKGETKHSNDTQKLYLVTFKQFLTWLVEEKHNQTLKEKDVGKINTDMERVLKTELDILTPDELTRIFESMRTLRNRALVEVLYESAGRIGELCKLKWSDVEFFDTKAVVKLHSKTKKPRFVSIYTSDVPLKIWYNQYPNGAKPDLYVFYGRSIKDKDMPIGTVEMSYDNASALIKAARQEAGIEKNVTPHTFRHTRITDLMKMGVKESTIKMIAWGNVATGMLKVYAHLVSQDAIDDMDRHYGLDSAKGAEPLADVVSPVQCLVCKAVCSKSYSHCPECGSVMNPSALEKQKRYEALIRETDVYKQLYDYMESFDIYGANRKEEV